MSDRYVKSLCLSVAFLVLWALGSVAFGATSDAVCRIYNEGDNSAGTGALIHVRNGSGLIVTCGHLFRDAPDGRIRVVFPDGSSHYAKLLSFLYPDPDLAALEIANPTAKPIQVTDQHAEELWAGGYGGNGQLRVVKGRFSGQSATESNTYGVMLAESPIRSGDSGGPVINSRGELSGVLWGASGNEVYFNSAKDTVAFLTQYCPGGVCRQSPGYRIVSPTQPRISAPVVKPSPPRVSCDCKQQIATITARLSALEATEPQRGPPGRDGTDGQDGKDAVLDRETINQIAQQAAQIVIQNQPLQEVKPFHIRAHKGAQYQPVKPGQYVTLIHGKQDQP